MKTARALIFLCLLAVIALRCESAYRELNSVNDLKNIDFGQSVPKHTLLLLHWFANTVDIDDNNVVHLTFNPNTDYGSHPFGNDEGMLPQGGRYYTVGSINQVTSNDLPEYVRIPLFSECEGTNTDRIVFSVQDQNTGDRRIDRIYITHHNDSSSGSAYNQRHTYQVSTNLLQQIRLFSIEGNPRSLSDLRDQFNSDDYPVSDISNTWGDQAHLGLLVMIVCSDENQVSWRIQRRTIPDGGNHVSNYHKIQQRDTTKIEVVTGKNGYAKIVWVDVDAELLKDQVAVVLFNDQGVMQTFKVIEDRDGIYQTSTGLSEGLRADLQKVSIGWFRDTVKEKILTGIAFQSSQEPVLITGYEARLTLFVRDRYACARLMMNKSFNDWKSEFYYSWVGFYTSAEKPTYDYAKWHWATRFTKIEDNDNENTYEYCSGLGVAAGVQARFIIKDYIKKASTPIWH